MESKKYIVCKDDIYVGEVVRTDSIYRYEGDSDFFNTKPVQLAIAAYESYRSMLFVTNEKGLSNDLLYNSSNYPILNVTDDEMCLNLKEPSIVIRDACNLAPLLEYFGYKNDLTYEDIIKIRKTFFTGRFAQDNCELFGFKETMAEDLTYYKNGKEVVGLKRKLRMLQYRIEQLAGYRMFSSISNYPLERKYSNILDGLGDNSLSDILGGWEDKINTFAPHKKEGNVKKLTRF